MISHHLTDELLMAYSAGTLPEAFDLAIATHLSLCDTCRASAESYDAVGGALVEDGTQAEMSDGALSEMLERIRSEAPEPVGTTPRPEAAGAPSVLPAPLAAFIGGDVDAVKWRPVGMGVKQAILQTADDAASARLLFIPAGTAMPDHGHRGTELTLVLQGAFSDEAGTFARGDVEIAESDDDHMPVADAGEPCICLAVTDAPLRFKGWLPRLAQPFLNI
ncbi:anti-sigma factor ChrR [Roseivivax marinus]|jgi:putative transcriptional regulator|uniref:Anti-sigma factor ChrR n=1 Tax=Roseivivax marinus TaxID=1379903 RepID=W4HG32_9RHOB|nr:ChrR family anti-sigma-E factor [Roseivivax marinus]ETW10930.1 anti-sigma factor ChrR [Roseivivax marinus]SEL90403.1 anti-ECFsigma factor, ChrR [Roseivivax marinus]